MRNIFAFSILAVYLGVASGCGAGRPSKYFQLTIPDNSSTKADPHPYPVTLLLGTDHFPRSLSGRPYCLQFRWPWHGHLRIPALGWTTHRDDPRCLKSRIAHIRSISGCPMPGAATLVETIASVESSTISRRFQEAHWWAASRLNWNCATPRPVRRSGPTSTPMTSP